MFVDAQQRSRWAVTDIGTLRVLADNPASIDLLGLGPIAAAVRDIVSNDNSDPITVGVHGPWGSGKSSLLVQVKDLFEDDPRILAMEVNPWEVADDGDVRGTIINTVLTRLEVEAPPDLKSRLKSLAKRISWGKATSAIAKGALTMQWDIEQLVDAFTPSPEEDSERTLAGFKEEFSKVMEELPLDRVVVLVDDLDRCLPTSVLATLEAVKLFLAVPKMAFVVAADQQLVREAITAGLGETRRSGVFARDYLDKIVQVPIAVPQPSRDDAECYVALLLAHRLASGGIDLTTLALHAERRRGEGALPYLAESPDGVITAANLQDARLIVAGLGVDDVVNPRRMKRFVNALAVREHAASSAGVGLDADVIAKLFMLEHRFSKQMNDLASLNATDRQAALASWEAWAAGETDGQSPGEPEDDLRTFFEAEPRLSERDTERYFVLARRLINSQFTSGLSEQVSDCVAGLLSETPAARSGAVEVLAGLSTESAEQVVDELVTRLHSSTEPAALLRALVLVGGKGVSPQVVAGAVRGRREDLTAGVAAALAAETEPALVSLAAELVNDPEVQNLAKQTLRNRLDKGAGQSGVS